MTEVAKKVLGFEYVIYHLTKWYKEAFDSDFLNNDLSKLKVIKLHFFVSAVGANSEDDLLGYFDNFYAMPYGHVESQVYDNLDQMQAYILTARNLQLKDSIDLDNYWEALDKSIKGKIDKSIESLKRYNPNLIKYTAMDLVELSHSWYSWRAMYKLALSFKRQSFAIPPEVIRNEAKTFHLSSVESLYAVY
ncbi:Panacea domain-containing protein [Pontibacter sp. E15-1]|uniref:SocA family protein n=1 Tax=Pontibacter sp. E15-1 TaxID=2919918 RepID=UPI001F4F8D7D|nr:SocA family protein [Pontibacter sp. E15-1]MCJ8164149.1 Panacea domain-containing protein [Pontibacter sp. E15-1]